MKMTIRYGCLTALLSLSAAVHAEVVSTTAQTTQSQQSQTQRLAQQAEQWGISGEDLQRYRDLMTGPRGMQSPGLDPLTTLGIEARTDAERRQYAEKWVKEEFGRTEKELKFQREVTSAWQRLYPDVLPVSLGNNAAGIAHDTGGRLALFVRAKDCAPCDARLSAVLTDKRPVDIYLVDSQGSDVTLRNWAMVHHIPVERVRSHEVTLNHDNGRWLQFGQGRMPVVLQQRSDGWHLAAF